MSCGKLPERRTGPPREAAAPCCPLCGGETDTLFLRRGFVVGCDNCVSPADAWEWAEGEENNFWRRKRP